MILFYYEVPAKLPLTLGLCAGVALEFRPPVTAARLLLKINVYNQCLAMLVKPGTNAAMLLMLIDTTSSRTCTKPNVVCSAGV